MLFISNFFHVPLSFVLLKCRMAMQNSDVVSDINIWQWFFFDSRLQMIFYLCKKDVSNETELGFCSTEKSFMLDKTQIWFDMSCFKFFSIIFHWTWATFDLMFFDDQQLFAPPQYCNNLVASYSRHKVWFVLKYVNNRWVWELKP